MLSCARVLSSSCPLVLSFPPCPADSGDERRGSSGNVLPGGREGLHPLVVAREPVDAGLDEDEAELGVLVLAVLVQVLADGDGLLDQEVEILWERRRQAVRFQDAEDLATGHITDLRNAEAVPQGDTDLRGSEALLRELADVVADVLRLHLDPGGRLAAIGQRRGRHALAPSVHAAHSDERCPVPRVVTGCCCCALAPALS